MRTFETLQEVISERKGRKARRNKMRKRKKKKKRRRRRKSGPIGAAVHHDRLTKDRTIRLEYCQGKRTTRAPTAT
ncbi:hypothetical protein M0804_014003 [Polistes exclamans]|nr:hypothetical protein M0804_014005 [Polistes exclamans]KAI4475922.1 hypothetical protein M0804_014003 [Polistes exclamans]